MCFNGVKNHLAKHHQWGYGCKFKWKRMVKTAKNQRVKRLLKKKTQRNHKHNAPINTNYVVEFPTFGEITGSTAMDEPLPGKTILTTWYFPYKI